MAQYTSSYTGAQIDSAIGTVGDLGTASKQNLATGIYGSTDGGSQDVPTVSAVIDYMKREPIKNYATGTCTDLNMLRTNRFDSWGSLTGVANVPPNVARGGCITLGFYIDSWGGQSVLQIFMGNDNKQYIRSHWNGTWSSWKEI